MVLKFSLPNIKIEIIYYERESFLKVYANRKKDDPWELEYECVIKSSTNINEIIKKVRTNYNFFKKSFNNVVMFSYNGIMYKNPVLKKTSKILTGELVVKKLNLFTSSSFCKAKIEINTIEDLEHLYFYLEDDIVVLGHTFYQNGQDIFIDENEQELSHDDILDIIEENEDLFILEGNIYKEKTPIVKSRIFKKQIKKEIIEEDEE